MESILIIVGAWTLYFFGFYYGKRVGHKQGMDEAKSKINILKTSYLKRKADN